MAFNPNPPRLDFQATAGQTLFTYNFKIFVNANLLVYHTPDATGVTTLLTEGVDYDATINGDDGGHIVLTTGAEANDFIVMQRELDINRLVEYQTSGDLLASTLNLDQEYQTYLTADLHINLGRAITVPPGVPGFDGQLPPPIPEAYLRWAIDGLSLENDTTPPTWRDETLAARDATRLLEWEAEAAAMTSNSYAVEPVGVFVKIYTSNGDGTFTATPTTSYSALHHQAKSEDASTKPRNRNLLINGGFNVWQRGIDFDVTGYTADRWVQVASAATTTRKQNSLIDLPFLDFVSITRSDGTAHRFLRQPIELEAQGKTGIYRIGSKHSFSMWVRSSSAINELFVLLRFSDDFALTNSVAAAENVVFSPITANVWTKVSGTFTITGTPAITNLTLHFQISSGTMGAAGDAFDFAHVQFEEGAITTSFAASFEQRPIGYELDLCKRYYQKTYEENVAIATPNANGNELYYTGNGISDQSLFGSVRFEKEMRVSPNITLYSKSHGTIDRWDKTDQDDIDIAFSNVSAKGFKPRNNTGAIIDTSHTLGHWVADAEL